MFARRSRIPGGLAGRTALVIVMALLALQAISAMIYWVGHDETRQAYSPRLLIRRIVAMTQLVDNAPPEDRVRLIAAFDEPILNVTIQSAMKESAAPMSAMGSDFFVSRIRAGLEDRERTVVIEPVRQVMPPGPGGPPGYGRGLRIGVKLSDGQWLVFSTVDEYGWVTRALIWLIGAVTVIGSISIFAARRIAQPFAELAAAAERFGLDPEAPPMPESGPREVRLAAQAFNRMQERLRRFVADRTQMLAAIGHDLRTPLTRLRLRADFIDDADIQTKMQNDLDDMTMMIDATLSFARDDAESERRAPLDLADLLQSLVEENADTGADVRYDGPAHLTYVGRPVALRRALGNLIGNAIKHGGNAAVTLSDLGDSVRIDIDDDGPGLPEDQIDRVFQPFYRADPARTRDAGTGVGLGLSIARTVLRRHGGDVTLANQPKCGLRATVSLPNTPAAL